MRSIEALAPMALASFISTAMGGAPGRHLVRDLVREDLIGIAHTREMGAPC